jgi:capsular exopolysaccharide synthesis family protein
MLLALFLESTDQRVSTPEEIEHTLGLPSIGVVPSLGKAWERTTIKAPGDVVSGGEVPQFLDFPAGISLEHWESYRSLRTALVLSARHGMPQTILVTSALAREGKTTTALNLATAFAQTGARTLLLELDLRRPAVAKLLGLKNDVGISSYLKGSAELPEIVQSTTIRNLHVVAAGPQIANPAESIGSGQMHTIMSLFRRSFQHIVVDTPPLLLVSDGIVASTLVDGVLLVAASGETPKGALRRAERQLSNIGVRLLGVVLNKMPPRKFASGYYGGGYYYSTDETGRGSDEEYLA